MLTPIVTACTVGLLSFVYRFVENNKDSAKPETFHLTFNGQRHSGLLHKATTAKENDDFMYNWAIAFCSENGKLVHLNVQLSHLAHPKAFHITGPQHGFDISSFSECARPLVVALKSRRKVVKDSSIDSYLNLNALPPVKSKSDQQNQAQDTPAPSTEAQPVTESLDERSDNVEESAESVASAGGETMDTVSGNDESRSAAVEKPTLLTHKLPLEINGVTYVFEYIVTYDILERSEIGNKLAVAFCNQHGAQLVDQARLNSIMQQRRNSGEENINQSEVIASLLKSDCVEPISGALVANMRFPSDF